MPPVNIRRLHRVIGLGIGLSSAGVLIFEIVLSRVFAVTQFNHFVFVTVSLALLGFGASGSLLTVFPELGQGGPRRWTILAAAQSVSTMVAYLLVNRFPFDSFSIAWDTSQVGILAFNYLALALPFLTGGLVIGVLLTGVDQHPPIPSHRVYAYSLIGSGLGCVAALAGLRWLEGEGMVAVAALSSLAAALVFASITPARSMVVAATLTGLGVLLALAAVAPPGPLRLELSEYKELSAVLRIPETEIRSTRWNAASRVDHITSPAIRSLPGLSYTYPGNPPPQDGLTFDGDDLSPIPLVAPSEAEFAPYMLSSLAYELRPRAEAAVLEPRGGLEVLIALAGTTESVTAVEPNELAIRAVGETDHDVYSHARVQTVVEEPRVYMERTGDRFDVIDLALTSPYRPVTSGAYSLAEDYLLTREAFGRYLDRLHPNGILAVTRWLQIPPSEESRLLATVAAAVRDRGADPVESIMALRGYATVLVLAAPDGFSPDDFATIRSFAEERRFDLIASPGLTPEAANIFNRLPEDDYYPLARSLLATADPAGVYAGQAFDIAPPTDDHPFFGHFFKWSQTSTVLDTLGTTWQPFGGAGYFVVVAVLVLATVAALVLIIAPLALARLRTRGSAPEAPGPRLWTFAYFGLLGLAFLFVEIPIIQQYILLIGQPTTSFAVVLFALLIASGIGSMVSPRIPWRLAAFAVTLAAASYPFLLPVITTASLPAPLPMRMLVGAVVLMPIGFLMGTMFPNGIALLERRSARLIPWAWGVNGVCSVISAVTAALLALSFGFRFVILVGAACYGVCALLVRPEAEATRPTELTPLRA